MGNRMGNKLSWTQMYARNSEINNFPSSSSENEHILYSHLSAIDISVWNAERYKKTDGYWEF
jgi:hypothetical protein